MTCTHFRLAIRGAEEMVAFVLFYQCSSSLTYMIMHIESWLHTANKYNVVRRLLGSC